MAQCKYRVNRYLHNDTSADTRAVQPTRGDGAENTDAELIVL